MNSAAKVLWPLAIIVALAFMALQRGGTSMENPLGDHRLDQWLSVGKR